MPWGLTRLHHGAPEWATHAVPEADAFSGHGCGEIFLTERRRTEDCPVSSDDGMG
jgi:hypothetical protein